MCGFPHIHVHVAVQSVCMSPAGPRVPSSFFSLEEDKWDVTAPEVQLGPHWKLPAALLHLPQVSTAPASLVVSWGPGCQPIPEGIQMPPVLFPFYYDRKEEVARAGNSTFMQCAGSTEVRAIALGQCSVWLTSPACQLPGLSCPLSRWERG